MELCVFYHHRQLFGDRDGSVGRQAGRQDIVAVRQFELAVCLFVVSRSHRACS